MQHMISEFFIGLNPSARIPTALKNRLSVAAGKTSGLNVMPMLVSADPKILYHRLTRSSMFVMACSCRSFLCPPMNSHLTLYPRSSV